MSEMVKQAKDMVSDGSIRGLPWGIYSLDLATKGLRPGETTVLAAGAGVGKSTIGMQAARRSAEEGVEVVYLSAEMAPWSIGERELYRMARTPLAVKPGTETNLGKGELEPWADNIRVYHLPMLPVSKVLQIVASRVDKGAGLVVVDNLKHIDASGDYRSDYHRISSGIASIHRMGQEHNVPIICLHHLNNQAYRGEDASLGWLRDSGQIAEEAEVVLFLMREREGATIRVMKCRQGAQRLAIRLEYDAKKQEYRGVR